MNKVKEGMMTMSYWIQNIILKIVRKKEPNGNSGLKSRKTKMKYSLVVLNSRFGRKEERMIKLEDR